MNIFLLIANLLTLLAFFVHTFIGDKEIRMIEPQADTEDKKRMIWTMARCGWHWISFDLLFASILLGMINFSDFLEAEKTILQLLVIYFGGYAIAWLIGILISKSFPKNYLQLGQWMLLLGIGALIFWGM